MRGPELKARGRGREAWNTRRQDTGSRSGLVLPVHARNPRPTTDYCFLLLYGSGYSRIKAFINAMPSLASTYYDTSVPYTGPCEVKGTLGRAA